MLPFTVAPSCSVSASRARSQSVTVSSAPDAAKDDSSVGCHSIEVMGARWKLSAATGVGSGPAPLKELICERHGIQENPQHLPSLLDIPQIPDIDTSLIPTTEEEIRGASVPAYDVHVAWVCMVDTSHAFLAFTPHIPDLNALVG